MQTKSLIGSFVIYYLLRGTLALYIGQAHQRMKWKIIHLDKELVMEATRNVERIQHFRRTYEHHPTWSIGHVLFTIRSRFGRMVRLYTLSLDNLHIYKHNQHIRHMSEMQKLSMEIYALVEIILDWDHHEQKKKADEKREFLENATEIIPSGPPIGKTVKLLRSAGVQVTKFPKKQALYKKPIRYDNNIIKLGGRFNSNPLQIYDGGFASDIN